ncbi:MAG TPA: NUDIX domain-containing protein [Tepidisphaeraceae bacterium]|nr:NUDIX domain-containing protein [Tepidisphaeraceae bacterium]
MPISQYLRQLRLKIGHDMVMMPAVTAIIVNEAGQVLLHRSRDDGNWYVIGGAPDPGEEPARAAAREAREETGLLVRPERLVGVYVDPPVRYTNGDKVMYTAMAFRCRPIGGELRVADDESLEVRYFQPDALPDSVTQVQRLKIEHALAGAHSAYFAWDEAWLKNL